MKKRFSFLIVLMLVTVLSVTAQNVKKNIETGFMAMQSANINKDFNKSIEYIADELFTVIPKDQLVNVLELTFNNPEVEIVLSMPEKLDISEAVKEGEKYYAILSFPNVQKIRMLDANGLPMNEENEAVKGMKANFELAVGAENVSFDKETKFFTVVVNQKTVAISENGKDGWKFLNYDKSQAAMLGPLLPAAIVEKLQ